MYKGTSSRKSYSGNAIHELLKCSIASSTVSKHICIMFCVLPSYKMYLCAYFLCTVPLLMMHFSISVSSSLKLMKYLYNAHIKAW